MSSFWHDASYTRVPGAQIATPNFQGLAVGSTHHTISPTTEPAPAALELHLGPEGTLALSLDICSNSHTQVFCLSLAQQPPWSCSGLGQCAGWISFLHFLEIPRSALPSGLFLSQRLSEPWGQPTPKPLPSLISEQLCHDSILLFEICQHLCTYEDRCVYMELLIFFLIFQLLFLHSYNKALILFFLSYCLSVSCLLFLFVSYFIDCTWSVQGLSAHQWFASHRGYQTHHSRTDGSFIQGARRDLRKSFLYIFLPALIHPTWLSIRSSFQVYR